MEIENEIWKPIVIKQNGVLYDFTGLYEVSNFGRVRSLNYRGHGKIKLMKPCKINSSGYLIVDLTKDGKNKNFRVHRLVATAFIPNPQNLETVNHKDYNRANNSVDNLEWLSREDNTREAHKHKDKALSEEHKRKISEANATKVLCIETRQVFDSIKEACNWLDINYKKGCSNISSCCRGKSETAYGYHWEYV